MNRGNREDWFPTSEPGGMHNSEPRVGILSEPLLSTAIRLDTEDSTNIHRNIMYEQI